MLPFVPESDEKLIARFREALEPVYTASAVKANPSFRPGTQRKHVFDFENGLRAIVSKDQEDDGRRWLHTSWSLEPEHQREYEINSLETFKNAVLEKLKLFLGGGLPVTAHQVVSKNCLHIFVPLICNSDLPQQPPKQ